MAPDSRDPRTLRLFDLRHGEAVVVRCLCGQTTEYLRGLLQRLHRIPSDTLIYDLQYRFRCKHCNRRDGFKIAIRDRKVIGIGATPAHELVVVEPET